MENLREEPFEFKPDAKFIIEAFRFLRRYKSHPDALEPYLDSFRKIGIPETNLSNVRMMLIAWRNARLDRQAYYRIDRYVLTGIGAIDLVLIPVLIPMGVSDKALFIAVQSLAISLVLTSLSFFVNFMKRDLGISSYGDIHSTLTFFAVLFGGIALTAAFWHVSSFIGVVFMIFIILAILISAAYAASALIATGFLKELQAALNTSTANTTDTQKE